MSLAVPNRLAQCTSPYLLQHAHNPVDWFPWGEEARRKALEEDKPIFLSIGYSACHWCHVMERESFENPQVAELLNREFVSIKVDREERPDLDDLYMGAVQTLTGRGGWPMSVWLTPEGRPFYGGTYFPLEPRFGFPGFIQLLERIAQAWKERRSAVLEDSLRLTESLHQQTRIEAGEGLSSERILDEALAQLGRTYDPTWGGFGGAPKFPPFLAVDLIFRRGSKGDRKMALRTLDAMAEGGIFDHLGGGFARYSVDGQWLVPHFEKMLYDNAQLVPAYLTAFLITKQPRYGEVARETLDYLLRDMRDGSGGFYSSEDADSEGEEGRFYVFTPAQVKAVLGDADGELFCRAFGVTPMGNFEGGGSVLHRFSAPEEFAGDEALEARLRVLRKRLWTEREQRVHPHKDDKVLASWNGLALSALALGFQVLGDVRYLDAATACAEFLHRDLQQDGELLRTWRRGQAHTPGFLEDYAAVALGLVDLYEAGFDPRWLRWAEELLETMRERFEDPGGGFYSTSRTQQDVILRQKPVFDHSIPSANALVVQALLRVGNHLRREDFLESAERALRHFSSAMDQAPRACLGLLQGLELLSQGPTEIVINGDLADARTQRLLGTAWGCHPARRMIALVQPGLSVHQERAQVQGAPTAYLCRNRACLSPATTPEALEALISAGNK